jgi:hypothetical protein
MAPKLPVFIICLAVAGCSDSSRFSFDHASTGFCVPHAYVIEAPLWLTHDVASDNGGFAFRGCGKSDVAGCLLPPELVAGTVGPRRDARGSRWADFPAGSTYHDVVTRALARHEYTAFPDPQGGHGQILSIREASGGSAAVMYWRTAADNPPSLHPGDELLARCKGVNAQRSASGAEVAFGCSRTVQLPDAAIDYDFFSGTITAAFVEDLDSRVISAVGKWRCP